MRLRPFLPVVVLLLAPALAACGDDEPDTTSTSGDPTSSGAASTEPTVSESASTGEASERTQDPEPSSAAPAAAAACDVVTSDDVAKAFGVSFGAGEADTDTTTEGKLAWKSSECSFEAKDLVDVTVKMTGAADFTQGTLTCAQPSDVDANVEPADDIAGATDGWWSVNSAPPLEATLRACSKTALVEVELDYEDGVDYQGDPRNQSAAVAELVLAALQG